VLITTGLHVPVIPLVEVPGSAGGVEFWQRGPIWVKIGVISVVTSISIVTSAAHWPASGVKVYVVVPTVVVLITAGLHVPAMSLFEVAGKVGAVVFWQSGPIWVNDGVISVVTSISIVTSAAHWPAAGVKVYVVVPTVVVLITAGLHVPAIPLFEVAGSVGAVEFWQRGPIWVKIGVISVVTSISIVAPTAH
jgi:hypothetical protein